MNSHKEVDQLYSAYNADPNKSIRNSLNGGSLNRRLNCDFSHLKVFEGKKFSPPDPYIVKSKTTATENTGGLFKKCSKH